MPSAHTPDMLLVNGRVTTLAQGGETPPDVEAVALRNGRVQAVGSTADLRALAGGQTQFADLGGRRVIPGLIDGHVHFARAGRTWNDELRWETVGDLATALGTIRQAAAATPKGSWIRAVGGWHSDQFAERRGPTQAELDQAAPDHPVFVQLLYDRGTLNRAGVRALGLTRDVADAIAPGAFELDADGNPTGVVHGMRALSGIYARLPEPTLEQQAASTAALSRDFARVGLTGLVDGGGGNTGPDAYQALYATWRRGELGTRVRLTMHASAPGAETEEYAGYRRYAHPHAGDDLLRVLGIGEVIRFDCHDKLVDDFTLPTGAAASLREVFAPLAEGGWTVQMHAFRPDTIATVLDIWEEIDRVTPIRGLRWSLVHGELLDAAAVRRLRALGAGVVTESLLYFEGDLAAERWGEARIADAPPLRALLDAGVPVAAGTDAMRVASYHPFTALRWYTTGTTVSGRRLLADHNLLTRAEALRLYTRGNAWFSFEEATRGALAPGMLADLAVLDRDYFTVPDDELPATRSALTLLGGLPVWADDAFAGLSAMPARP